MYGCAVVYGAWFEKANIVWPLGEPKCGCPVEHCPDGDASTELFEISTGGADVKKDERARGYAFEPAVYQGA